MERRKFVMLCLGGLLAGCQTTTQTGLPAGADAGANTPAPNTGQTGANPNTGAAKNGFASDRTLTREQTLTFKVVDVDVSFSDAFQFNETGLSYSKPKLQSLVEQTMNAALKPANPDGPLSVRAEVVIKGMYIKPPGRRRAPGSGGADISSIGVRVTYFDAQTGQKLGRGMDVVGNANAAGNILASALVGQSLGAQPAEDEVRFAVRRAAVNARIRLYGRDKR